jgi:hypothetical protein
LIFSTENPGLCFPHGPRSLQTAISYKVEWDTELERRRQLGIQAARSRGISIPDEIVHLRHLDLRGLRTRWQNAFGRPAPEHVTRYLLFRIIAYKVQPIALVTSMPKP